MDIAIVYEDGTENELSIDICCPSCSRRQHGWTEPQFLFVADLANKSAISVPNSVITEMDFIVYIRGH